MKKPSKCSFVTMCYCDCTLVAKELVQLSFVKAPFL